MRSQRRHSYSRESVAHALAHHQDRGAITSVVSPQGDRRTWSVVVPKFGSVSPFELTEPQAYALCIGLAAGEDRAQLEHERFVGELRAYNDAEPPCVVDEHADELLLLRRLVRIADSALDRVIAPLSRFKVVTDSVPLTEALERALSSAVLPAGSRCGIHGVDTSSGRCAQCDAATVTS